MVVSEKNGVIYTSVAARSGAEAFDLLVHTFAAYEAAGMSDFTHVTLRSVDGRSLERLRTDEVRVARIAITSDSNRGDTEAFQTLEAWAERNGVERVFSILVVPD